MNLNKKNTGAFLVMLACIPLLLIAACTPAPPAEPTLDANEIFTQAAITVSAKLTSTALAMPTETPTATAQPTNTQAPPTATATTPLIGQVTGTPPTMTLAPNPNKMEFLGDVTIPDGQIIPAGSKFVKTWRVKNIGTTTWTENFRLRHWAGERYGAATSILLGKEVKPGETTEISIEFTAPLNNGEYMSMWILSDEDEANFGTTFYVKFVVGVIASPTVTTAAATTVAPTAEATLTPTP